MMKQYSLSDKKVIVTAGPTREFIDPFRYISNPSSGKMGIELAKAAYTQTKHVTLIHGYVKNSLLDNVAFPCVSVGSTAQLCERVCEHLYDNSVLIMAAAPVDYTPLEFSSQKIKKSGEELVLRLKRTPDVLSHVAAIRKEKAFHDFISIGFAAETENLHDYAKEKLLSKELDFICLNDISKEGRGFAGSTNEITVFGKNGIEREIPLQEKKAVAFEILRTIFSDMR